MCIRDRLHPALQQDGARGVGTVARDSATGSGSIPTLPRINYEEVWEQLYEEGELSDYGLSFELLGGEAICVQAGAGNSTKFPNYSEYPIGELWELGPGKCQRLAAPSDARGYESDFEYVPDSFNNALVWILYENTRLRNLITSVTDHGNGTSPQLSLIHI